MNYKKNNCTLNGIDNQIYDAQKQQKIIINTNDINNIISNLDIFGKTVIFGGHYYIFNPENPNITNRNAEKTFETSCKLKNEFNKKNIESYISLMLNDIEFPNNINKKEARILIKENFKFPNIYRQIMNDYNINNIYNPINTRSRKGNKNIENVICKNLNLGTLSEKTFVNRFNSKTQTSFLESFPNISKKYFNLNVNNGVQQACTKAITQYIFDLYNTNVNSVIMVVPGCAKTNIELGINTAKEALPEMDMYAIYQTTNCYE